MTEENVYTTYGYHITSNSYFICHDKSVTNRIFERLRTWNETVPSYPDKLAEFKITGIRDLTNGYDSREADLKAVSFARALRKVEGQGTALPWGPCRPLNIYVFIQFGKL